MLSLPLPTPNDDHILYLLPSHHHPPSPPTSPDRPHHHQHHHHGHQPSQYLQPSAFLANQPNRPPPAPSPYTYTPTTLTSSAHTARHKPHPSTSLAALRADEFLLSNRKHNVRRFGAGWLRPPGVVKTLQQNLDETAEKEEQEVLAAREERMMELARAAEREELERLRAAGEEDGGEGERDLDADIPEADETLEEDVDVTMGDGDDVDVTVDEEEGLGTQGTGLQSATVDESAEGDVTFNEDSMLESSIVLLPPTSRNPARNSMLQISEDWATGIAHDEIDLDEDVPEAGSYQHTDTEVEDDSSSLDTDEVNQRFDNNEPRSPSVAGGDPEMQRMLAQRNYALARAARMRRLVFEHEAAQTQRRASGRVSGGDIEGSSFMQTEISSLMDGGSSFLQSSPVMMRPGTGSGNGGGEGSGAGRGRGTFRERLARGGVGNGAGGGGRGGETGPARRGGR
ncbi:hypothetical protein K402DRAFT_389586 [Aulographum hederae CBS 113979]|uniref:Uncharacterized protein n=1 Tax=Aulographum hederae CBS 113979 TaxID=1176131 RepID=A0A6G1HBQ6_9PEZI|nr:hypothetical protein K402DRAFT_389586 [Aulographum hederae CBS 113979]